MGKNDTRNILIFTAGVAGLIGAGVLLARAKGETGPAECRDDLLAINTIKIETVSIRPEGENFFVFDVPYHNQTCQSQDVAILMQIQDKDGIVIQLRSHEFFLGPGQTKNFEWRIIIPTVNRDIGKNKIQFFVWSSLSVALSLSNTKTLFV